MPSYAVYEKYLQEYAIMQTSDSGYRGMQSSKCRLIVVIEQLNVHLFRNVCIL